MSTRSRFERPDTTTLTLKSGDTITVKRRLNYGEARKMRGMQQLQTLHDAAVVIAYLLDWTLTGLDGERQSIAGIAPSDLLNVLDALSDDAFDEIYAAISTHIAGQKAEREAEKNDRDGESSASVISPSPSGATGASNGSEPSMLTTTMSS